MKQTKTTNKAWKIYVHYTTSDTAEVLIWDEDKDMALKKAEALWKKENPKTQVISVELI